MAKIGKENEYLRKMLAIDESSKLIMDNKNVNEQAQLLSLEEFDFEKCSKNFTELNTPEQIQDMLIEAKMKKSFSKKVIENNFKNNKPIELMKGNTKENMENELLELSEKAMESISGSGEIIDFDPSGIDDPFLDFGKDSNDTENKSNL